MLDFTSSSEQQETETRHGQFALRDLLNGIFYYRRLALIVAGSIIGLGILVNLWGVLWIFRFSPAQLGGLTWVGF